MTSQSSDLAEFKEYLGKQILKDIYPGMQESISEWFRRSKCEKPKKPRDQDALKTTFNGKIFSGTCENVVNSLDGRKQIHTTDSWPHSVHGVIEGEFGEENFKGTGIMIGPNIVLTAGHNIFDYAKKTYANIESMRFLPGANGQFLPFGKVKIEKYFVPDEFLNKKKEDFGILILEEFTGDITGYFGIAWLRPAELLKKKIYITGYPEDKVKPKPGTFEMWGMEGKVEEVDEDQGLISYKIDTSKGQSGSGVVYKDSGEYFVWGVHVQGGENTNIATLLTKRRYEGIYKWIEGHVKTNLFRYLRNCENLVFQHQEISLECLSFLCGQNSLWNNITKLNFHGYTIIDDGAKALGQNTSWINLSDLNLSHSKMSIEGVKLIAENISWINLKHLSLEYAHIDDERAKALAQNTSWIHLSKLDLSWNEIGDEGAKALGQNTSWKNLLELDLSNNNIKAEGTKGLGQNTSWTNLCKLDLSNRVGSIIYKICFLAKRDSSLQNQISDEGTRALAQNVSWRKLSELDLSYNKIGDEGAKALAQNTSWINLSKLDLDGNNISDKGAKLLTKMDNIVLKLSWNNISYEGDIVFQKRVSSSSKLNHLEIFLIMGVIKTSKVKSTEIFSVWKTIQQSKALDTLRIQFSSYYRSFLMRVISLEKLEDFIIKISYLIHFRLDFNNSLFNVAEEEDEKLVEEFSLSLVPSSPLFASKKQPSIEESCAPTEKDFDGNFNSYLSAEGDQLSLKHAYLNSS